MKHGGGGEGGQQHTCTGERGRSFKTQISARILMFHTKRFTLIKDILPTDKHHKLMFYSFIKIINDDD